MNRHAERRGAGEAGVEHRVDALEGGKQRRMDVQRRQSGGDLLVEERGHQQVRRKPLDKGAWWRAVHLGGGENGYSIGVKAPRHQAAEVERVAKAARAHAPGGVDARGTNHPDDLDRGRGAQRREHQRARAAARAQDGAQPQSASISSASTATALRTCSSLCSELRKKRRRAPFSGTAGYRIGCTLMPRRNRACERRAAPIELPVIAGTMAMPLEGPTSTPASRARCRNCAARACSASTRPGSARMRSKAASEAAASGGAMPTL